MKRRRHCTPATISSGRRIVLRRCPTHCWFAETPRVSSSARRIVRYRGEPDVFSVGDKSYAFVRKADAAFIENTVVPMLNAGCRTFYTTARFRTFGRTEAELRELLKDLIKNRNRIMFDFYPSLCECEVTMRYSSKTAKASVDDMIAEVATG